MATKSVTCRSCGVTFEYEPGTRGRRRLYCSAKCRHNATKRARPKTEKKPIPARICKVCGNGFAPRSHGGSCCSPECAREVSRAAAVAYAAIDPRNVEARKRRTRTCKHCGKTFVAPNPSGKQRAGKSTWAAYCSRACSVAAHTTFKYGTAKEAKRAEHDRWRMRRGIASLPPVPDAIECAVCGITFKPRSHLTRVCSSTCRTKDERRRAASYGAAKKPLVERRCEECGNQFTPEYGNKHRNFCSEFCCHKHVKRIAKSKRRARERGATSESVDPLKVFRRDKWVCHLCGKKTVQKLRGLPFPDAPELDHIVTLADGGAHTYANTACSHRKCNHAKGARSLGQLRLFG